MPSNTGLGALAMAVDRQEDQRSRDIESRIRGVETSSRGSRTRASDQSRALDGRLAGETGNDATLGPGHLGL